MMNMFRVWARLGIRDYGLRIELRLEFGFAVWLSVRVKVTETSG